MKIRVALIATLALLATTSMVFAAPPATTANAAGPAAVAPGQTPDGTQPAAEELTEACADDAQSPLLAQPLEDVLPQSHCSGGFPVDSCSECPGCACTRFLHPCCYCQ